MSDPRIELQHGARKSRRNSLLALAIVGVLSAGLGSVSALQAESENTPAAVPLAGQPQLADIIEQVQPAVVNIVAQRSMATPAAMQGMDPRMQDLLRRFFDGEIPPTHPSPHSDGEMAGALGSGFIIDASGYVVTNNHVIEDADKVQVVLDGGKTLDAEVIGTDPRTDLAVLKVHSDSALPAVNFGDSDKVRVGEWVIAIGNPFGLGGTATAGIVSARGRDIQSGPYDDYLQIDAPINRGNSGGPVFDTAGRVIGVNTAIFSPNGGSVGIGFAIPASQAQPVVRQIIDQGHVTRGWLGVQIQAVSPEIADSLGLEDGHGALVADVAKSSPADKSGLQVTDVILDFDGEAIEDTRELVRQVAKTAPGEKVPVTVWRDGKQVKLQMRVGTLEEPERQASARTKTGAQDPLGLEVAPLDERARARLGLDQNVKGVLVTQVAPGSAAARQGLRPGDVITRIGQSPVDTPEDLSDKVTAAKEQGSDSVLALVRRGDAQRFVALDLG